MALLGTSSVVTIMVSGVVGWKLTSPLTRTAAIFSQCEMAVVDAQESAAAAAQRRSSIRMKDWTDDDESFWVQLKRLVRMIRRLIKLSLVFSPVVALYPLYWIARQYNNSALGNGDDNNTNRGMDAQDLVLRSLEKAQLPGGMVGWYYKLCLSCVEWSGAACIKIMQWAGSRPDMFGEDFCAVFSQLQDDTTPHSWHHTEEALIETYGENWRDHVRLGELLGSGCIAQVHKGVVVDHQTGEEKQVAIKVMHPNVEDDIDADLDILRLSVQLLEHIDFGPIRNLKWINLPGFIEEMAIMLKIQLDLRTEAEHLVQFNKNFEGNKTVVFPKLVQGYDPSKRVLIETFCDGMPLMEFIRTHTKDRALLSNMCAEAIKAVCQMIFLDNFTHGDLHPGNVLVSHDYKFMLLDVGIVTKHSPSDHKLVSDVLAAFIRCDGERAGRLMIADSDARLASRGDHSLDEEYFVEKIEWLTVKASGRGYLMEHLGKYITYIANAAATHHVMLNQAFISSALAVKVQEGIALAMDPSIEIWRLAVPIILESERRHGRAKQRAAELMGLENVFEWITGESSGKREQREIEKKKQRIIDEGLDEREAPQRAKSMASYST